MNRVATLLMVLILAMGTLSFSQTATVAPNNNTTTRPYNGVAVPVHLQWGPPVPSAGWTFIDYCVGEASASGQEHPITSKGCGTHVAGTSLDVYPPVGPHYWVIWAEFVGTDGRVGLSLDSNEASCDLEVLSETTTLTTYYCKGAVVGSNPNPPGLSGNWN